MQMKGKHYILRFLFVNRNLAGFVNSSDSYVVTRESASVSRHNLDIASNKRCPFFFHLDSQIPRFENNISRKKSRYHFASNNFFSHKTRSRP